VDGIWGPITHLLGVKNSPELRQACEDVQDDVIQLGLRLSQSKPIYEKLKALCDGEEWPRLTPTQQRIVTQRLTDAKLAGIELEGEAKKRFNDISAELSKLATKFSNNVLDATKAFALTITDSADV